MQQNSDIFMHRLLKNVSDAIIASDTDYRINEWNPAAERLYGYMRHEVLGKTVPEVTCRKYLGCSRAEVIRTFERDGYWEGEVQETCRDGRQIIVLTRVSKVYSHDGAFIGLVAVNTDVTQKKLMEEEMIQKAKLESMGFLVGSVAHSFNNSLMTILACLSVSRHYSSGNQKVGDFLQKAESACLSIRDTMQQLMIVSGEITPVFQVLEIRTVLDKAIARFSGSQDIDFETDIPPDIRLVWGNENHLIQVFEHVFINAAEAMEDGGKIRLSVFGRVPREDGMSEPEQLVIRVQDSGHGIPDDILGKVFEPFFSTRGLSRGLGLPVCRSILRQHGGAIEIGTPASGGTEVVITLPLLRREPSGGRLSASRRILVFESDEFINRFLCDLTDEAGYDVVGLRTTAECIGELRKSREHTHEFSLIIINVDMDMTALIEILQTVKYYFPEMPVIATSKNESHDFRGNEISAVFSGWLIKPFTLRSVETEIKRVLGV